MFGIFNIMSRRNLKKLDAELSKIDYDTLIGGLNQLSWETVNENPADKNTEELRALYAITQCCLELKKIYREEE